MKHFGLQLVLPLALLLAGCSFVSPYDETTDRLLTDLSVKTQTAIAAADAGQLSVADREKFFSEAIGTLETIKARATLLNVSNKNQEEISAIEQLEQRFRDLQQHGGSPRTSLTTGLRATLLALQQIEIAKKRSSVFSAGLKKSTSTQ